MSSSSSGLVAFINQLAGDQLEALFVQPYAVVALLRSLQPVARHILMRFVCTGGDVSSGKRVRTWSRAVGLMSTHSLRAVLCSLML